MNQNKSQGEPGKGSSQNSKPGSGKQGAKSEGKEGSHRGKANPSQAQNREPVQAQALNPRTLKAAVLPKEGRLPQTVTRKPIQEAVQIFPRRKMLIWNMVKKLQIWF